MIATIALNKILPNPYQTRIGEPDAEYIKALALDIAAHGLLQTPIGRQAGENVELAFGHNRLAAFRRLNKLLLPGISQAKTLVEAFAEEEARDGL